MRDSREPERYGKGSMCGTGSQALGSGCAVSNYRGARNRDIRETSRVQMFLISFRDLQHRTHPGLYQVSTAAPPAMHLQAAEHHNLKIFIATLGVREGRGGQREYYICLRCIMSHSAQNLNRNVRQNNWVRREEEDSLLYRAQRTDGAHFFFFFFLISQPLSFLCSSPPRPPITLVASTGLGGGEA